MRTITLAHEIHYVIGPTDVVELTMPGLEKMAKEVGVGNCVEICVGGFVVFRCPPAHSNVVEFPTNL
jgi:hypothetical protein